MSLPPLILFDANAICHTCKHGMPDNLSHEELKTEIIFGFTNKLLMYAKKFKSNRFAFAWDSRKSLRKKIYPEYKAKRNLSKEEKTPKEKKFDNLCYHQFNLIRRKVLPALGFNNSFLTTGYEADDIIARIVQDHDDIAIITISADEDLWQLLTKNHSIFSSASIKKAKMRTEEWFLKEYDLEPVMWAEVKALAGCKSDEVEGLPGVGEKTAVKFLLDTLPVHYKTYRTIIHDTKILKRNRPLVTLPYEGTPFIPLKNDTLYIKDFVDVFDRYGFKSHLRSDKLQQWITIMELK